MKQRETIRNIAIIAHVDHGKTTLVDKIIHGCQAIDARKDHGELILDNNDLERERGITILSKNVSVMRKKRSALKYIWTVNIKKTVF